jgi:hypothetical protein
MARLDPVENRVILDIKAWMAQPVLKVILEQRVSVEPRAPRVSRAQPV